MTRRWATAIGLVAALVTSMLTVGPAKAGGAPSSPPKAAGPASCPPGLEQHGRSGNGAAICSHGDDGDGFRNRRGHDHGSHPHGTGAQDASSVEPGEAAVVPAPGSTPASVPCFGDGTSGARVQVIYARSSDRPDRYAELLPQIRQIISEMDDVYNESAKQTGGHRHLRFVTDSSCVLTVPHVVMPTNGDDTFANTRTALAAAGHNLANRKYLTFVDANVLCGIGQFFNHDDPSQANFNNTETLYSRVDVAGFCFDAEVAAHELGHNLGAVQASAPHATKFGHCYDDADIMCYDDNGGGDDITLRPNDTTVAMSHACALSNSSRMDCNHDDYFHTAPAANSYLATKWNVANARFMGAPGVPEPPLSVATTPLDSGATVTWGTPSTSTASAVTGYRVRVWDGEQIVREKLTDAAARSTSFGFSDGTNLTNGTPYVVTVAAVNAVGESDTAREVVEPAAMPWTTIAISNAWQQEPPSTTVDMPFTLTRSGGLSGSSSVTVSLSGASTATSGVDTLVVNATTVTFGPGESTKTFNVGVRPDVHPEMAEALVLRLTNPSGAIISDDSGEGTIWDFDAGTPATVAIDDTTVSESAGSVNVTLHRRGYTAEVSTVYVATANSSAPRATAGSDFTALGQTQVKFLAGETQKTVAVTIAGDAVDEQNERFNLTVTTPTKVAIADTAATVTIVDDDGPVTAGPTTWLSLDDVRAGEIDAGDQSITVTARRHGVTTGTTTVSVASDSTTSTAVPADFNSVGPLTLTFNPGETAKTFAVVVRPDTRPEAVERVVLKLSAPSGGAALSDADGAVIISDNDPGTPATVAISDAFVLEGDAGTATLVFTVTRSGVTTESVHVKAATVNAVGAGYVPATAGSDYTALASTTVIFAAGETTKVLTVDVTGDTSDAATEHLFVTLSSPTRGAIADPRGVGTITNDD